MIKDKPYSAGLYKKFALNTSADISVVAKINTNIKEINGKTKTFNRTDKTEVYPKNDIQIGKPPKNAPVATASASENFSGKCLNQPLKAPDKTIINPAALYESKNPAENISNGINNSVINPAIDNEDNASYRSSISLTILTVENIITARSEDEENPHTPE